MIPVAWAATLKEIREVKHWADGHGPVTPAVHAALYRGRLTFGIALVTRKYSDSFCSN